MAASKLSGSIPPALFQGMTALQSIQLVANQLVGTVPPSSLLGLSSLSYVHARRAPGVCPCSFLRQKFFFLVIYLLLCPHKPGWCKLPNAPTTITTLAPALWPSPCQTPGSEQ